MKRLKQTLLSALSVVVLLFGSSLAASAGTITEGFDSFSTSYEGMTKVLTLPEGWDCDGDASLFVRDNDTYHTKRPAIMVEGTNTGCYLITPALTGDFTFFLRNRTKNYQASVKAYACTYADGVLTLGSEVGSQTLAKTSSGVPSWQSITFTASIGTRIALLLSNAIFDDFTYTEFEASAEPSLAVAGTASGETFDFGTVVEGTTHTFTLQNTGNAELIISKIEATGGYTVTEGLSLTSIAAMSTASITVATPAADAEGALTITSNDANSPYTILLKSVNKVPQPIMGVSLTEVLFGKVAADATQDVIVSNTGDAELQVTIVSDKPEEFAVSKSSLTIAPGAEDTFTITFLYQATAFGGHAATITLTPNAGEAATIAASAQVADPNAWKEDFSGNALPDGWAIVGTATSWTFDDGEAKGKYEGEDCWLLTPKLIVKEGEALTFQARSYQFGSDIKVQCQKDGGEWEAKISEARNTQDAFETYTIEGLEPGTYRFRIATENIILDNFEGFTLVPSEAVRETWYVSYTFHYMGDDDTEQTESDVEEMEIEFDGDDVSFNFPNPIMGNTWMKGTKSAEEGPVSYIFPNGQYIGKFGNESAYYCGSNGSELTDMQFYYDEEAQTFHNFQHILINSSQTVINYWGYFSDVLVSKIKPEPTGIARQREWSTATDRTVFDLQGRQITRPAKGLYIVGGRKVIIR